MKNIKISVSLKRKFSPCYDPSEVMSEDEEITLKEAIVKYRNSVKSKDDIIWVLCRKEFMSDKEMRLFAVWCAREALKLVESPDPRSVAACDVSEKYANGEATDEELAAAWEDASAAACNAARDAAVWSACNAARYAAWAANAAAGAAASAAAGAAAGAAASAAAYNASRDASNAARDAQIDKLLTYFE